MLIVTFLCVLRLLIAKRRCKKYNIAFKSDYFWHLPQAYDQITCRGRGTYGELQLVNQLLNAGFKTTAVYHDLYVTKRDKHTTQIDAVLCTDIGLIVFEVKDYSGWIFGRGTQNHWMQIKRYGRGRRRFYNPIMQNAGHIRALRQQYALKNIPMYSVIVFYGSCKLKNVSQIPENVRIGYGSGYLLQTVDELLNIKPKYNYADKRVVAQELNKFVRNGDDPQLRIRHKEHLHKYLDEISQN